MYKINHLFIISILFLFSFTIHAQTEQIDSLKSVVDQLPDDTTKVDALNDLSKTLMSSSLDETILYAEQARDLADSLNYESGKAWALKNIGLGYYHQSDFLNVFDYWEQSLEIFKELGDQKGIANLESNLGSVYFNQGDDANAIDYFLRSLTAAESIDDSLGMGRALIGIGIVYQNKESTYEKAKEYNEQALLIFEQLNYGNGIATCAVNLGNIYLDQSQYVSALYYLQKSVDAFENEVFVPHSLTLIGQAYSGMGNYQKAMEYLEQAINKAEQLNLKMEMAQALVGLAKTLELQEKPAQALNTYKQAEQISLEIGGNYELKDVYQGMALISAELGNYRGAFNYFQHYDAVKDTLFNLETDEKIKGLQFTYQIEKKQSEVDDLVRDQKLQELEIKQQRYINYAAIISGVILLIFAGGMFNRYRFIRRTKKIIEKEKDRSDKLLLNILPEETADELKEKGAAKARSYNNVTILFTDFKGFTELSATLSPPALVKEIHLCYMAFDEIMVKHKVEKIKTIGDAYMAAGGLPMPNDSHPIDVTLAAIEIREFMDKLILARKKAGKPFFEIRIGIHSGPVVAGVVGIHKFAYDIWGDTVNIASRMESNSEPGKINISDTTYSLIKDRFDCTPRGEISVKGAGKKTMFFVERETSSQLINQ